MDSPSRPTLLSCQQVRDFDRFAIEQLGIPGLVLMENAARGCVDLLLDNPPVERVLIVCGKGNNGGDGLAMARHLLVRNRMVKVLLIGDPRGLQGDASINYDILSRIAGDSIRCFPEFDESRVAAELQSVEGESADWIVDALLGTGTTGKIREPYSNLISLMNQLPANRFAVDLPSGLNAENGESLGPVFRADITGTFVSQKKGFTKSSAGEFLGKIHVLDIGVPFESVELE